ncbi:minichromosome maintenance protein MCM [Vulcanisaeta thermophila]|uniref:minichromosome maintenance protein MCM n=1 Tax=Vulcanisaeta thermophila TaxID=867917 RepID=UPI0008538A35|nr:minichromosome maintenance protein MCM [Vulcanisaeta thermophila]
MTESEEKVVNVDDAIQGFRDFIEGDEKYVDEINNMIIQRRKSLVIDFHDLLLRNKDLADMLIERPQLAIQAASEAVRQAVTERDPELAKSIKNFYARFKRLPETVPIRKLRSEVLGKLIMVEGIVTRQTPPKHYLKKTVFRCSECGFELEIPQPTTSFVQPPRKCPKCGATNSFVLVEERSELIDWQKIIVQEKPEELPPGQLPRNIEAILLDDLVDTVKPGDRVYLVGIMNLDIAQLRKNKPPILSSFMEVNYVEGQQREFVEIEITPEDERRILEIARSPNVRERIIKSIAPSIYGMENIKEAIACLLFGGVPKVYPDGIRVRGDIHILLVGDPGMAKTQLLRFVAKIAPRAVYTTGKGSSAAGLTAAVVREKDTGEFYLEAGALVLADTGVAVIDELDKMDAKDRVAIHEALEQQTVSIAKAGIVATLNARASVLAAANPAFGRYLPNRTVAENVDLPVTLLSRFDLIFIIRDEPSMERDRAIAEHIVTLHAGEVPESFSDIIPPELLRKYIAYARKHIKPVLTPEARERIVQFYVQMRNKSREPGSPIAITARQLEALIRLAEAEARMRLSPVVEAEDADKAIRLFMSYLSSVGIDVESGKIDIDVIMTGKPRSSQERLALVMDILSRLEEANGGKPVRVEDLYKEAEGAGLDRQFVDKALNMLVKSGDVYMPRPGYVKRVVV